MKRIALILLLLMETVLSLLAGGGEETPEAARSAWTASRYSRYGDGVYEEVLSPDTAAALFIDGDRVTMIYPGSPPVNFRSVRTQTGYRSDENVDLPICWEIHGKSMGMTFLGHAWHLDKVSAEDAAAYARWVAGEDVALPFGPEAESAGTEGLLPLTEAAETSGTEPAPERSAPKINYVVNVNTGKFHSPGCASVGQIKPENRWDYTGTREELISQGYSPCGRCHP